MAWFDDLNAMPDVGTVRQFQAPQQPKKKKNFWLDQISTAGGIIGGIGGSFIAPLAGTAGGAAVGSGLGEALENALMGESLGKNVLKEGALGAAFGVGPVRGLKAVAGGAKALAKGNSVAEGAKQAASKSIRGKAGGVLTDAGDDLLVKQFRLTPTQLKNFKSKFGEDASAVIKRYGFQNADDVVAKGVQPLQGQYDTLVGSIAKPISFDDFAKSIEKRAATLMGSAAPDTQKTGQALLEQLGTLRANLGSEGFANGAALNKVKKDFDALVNYTEKQADPRRYTVNKYIADSAREVLNAQSPALREVGRELQKVRQFADNASKQEQLGRGNLPLNLPTLLGGGIGAAGGGPLGAIGAAAGTALANSPTGRRAAAKGADVVGSRLSQAGERSAMRGMSPLGIGARVGAGGIASSALSQEPSSQPSLEQALIQSGGQQGMSGDEARGADVQRSPYGRENLLADMQRDPKNADKYFEYYTMLQEAFAPTASEKPLSAESSKIVSNAQTGIQALLDFESAIDQDPSVLAKRAIPGRGALGGALGGVLGTRSADAAAAQIVDVIARLRTGAAITNDEAKRFETFIPQAFDPPDVRRQKVSYLANQFQMVAQRGASSQPGNLEDAVIAAQGR